MRSASLSHDTTWYWPASASLNRQEIPSPFAGHSLKPVHELPAPRHAPMPVWIPAILLLSVILMVWAKASYPKRIMQIFQATLSRRNLKILMKEGEIMNEQVAYILGFLYVLMFSLLVFSGFRIWFPDHTGFYVSLQLYLLTGVVLVLFWMVKVMLIRILENVFSTGQTTREYLINLLVFTIVTGIFILPVLILSFYIPSRFMLLAGGGVAALLFAWRFVRGFMIGLSLRRFSYLFLFVYLCTLEILPLILLVKLVLMFAGMAGG